MSFQVYILKQLPNIMTCAILVHEDKRQVLVKTILNLIIKKNYLTSNQYILAIIIAEERNWSLAEHPV